MSPARVEPLGKIGGSRGPTTSTRASGRAPCAGAEHARDHGNTGNGVQRFRHQRSHAGARAGGKHDETNSFVSLR